MRINLTTSYSERNEAKVLGAKWDNKNRTWYVDIKTVDELKPFEMWIPNFINYPKQFPKKKQKKRDEFDGMTTITVGVTTGKYFIESFSDEIPF